MKIPAFLHRLTPVQSLTLSAGLLVTSALLLWLHAKAVDDMRDVGLPAALALPQIEKRMEILKEQNEIAELQSALRGGSQEELLNAYVLPAEANIDRLLAIFDVLFNYLEQKRELRSFSAVQVGEAAEGAIPVSFEAVVTDKGLSDLLLFVDIAGLMTVSDALTQEDIDRLLTLTEQENPASVAALEHFLSTDLLRYSREPKPYEEQLRKSFSPAAEPLLQAVFDGSTLRRSRELFADLGGVIDAQNLWPLRLLTVQKASSETLDGGLVRVSLTLNAHMQK